MAMLALASFSYDIQAADCNEIFQSGHPDGFVTFGAFTGVRMSWFCYRGANFPAVVATASRFYTFDSSLNDTFGGFVLNPSCAMPAYSPSGRVGPAVDITGCILRLGLPPTVWRSSWSMVRMNGGFLRHQAFPGVLDSLDLYHPERLSYLYARCLLFILGL
jgi:hypothetical protein